jgi:predicted permease
MPVYSLPYYKAAKKARTRRRTSSYPEKAAMRNLFSDIRYSLRVLRQTPVFTLTAVLTLALGLGGTTAIFSLIHAVMLRSLPVADPESLYRIGDGNDCCVASGPQDRWGLYSFSLFEKLKAALPELEQVAAFQAGGWRLSVRRASVDRLSRPLRSEFVTGTYFSTFGIRSFGGRLISNVDDQSAAPPVAVLSYRAWQSMYGGDPSVVGSSYIIDGHPFTVVGITPPGFYGETLRSDPPDIWLPLQQEPLLRGQGSLLRQPVAAWLRVIGRLRPGASMDGLSPRLTGILWTWLQTESGFPASWPKVNGLLSKQNIDIVPAGSGVEEMKEDYARSLQILLSVCSLVLLIACANLANLLLVRGTARRTQTSIRLAIGASRTRIIGQSLTENILIALAGGVAGLIVADGAERLILAVAFGSNSFLPISTAPRFPFWHLHLPWRFLRACFSGRLQPGWLRAPTRLRRCAAPVAARPTVRPCLARRCWSFRRHYRSSWLPERAC